ncbi:hypothetical protein [Caulobacter soli]|uniref:hypothetical protein n=1 Tax=Caulobacter soli TaxID=2708539 RepID=UPI0013EA64F6|nr:hypothetical protein [Caulobacter soli]
MLRPSSKQTTLPRAFRAIVFAFVFPPFVFTLIPGATNGWTTLTQAPGTFFMLVVVSVLFGWPPVIFGGLAWMLLQRLGRHHVWCAMLVGAAAGGLLGEFLAWISDDRAGDPAMFILAVVGAATGLGVWVVAYGGRERPPVVTRPPLAL